MGLGEGSQQYGGGPDTPALFCFPHSFTDPHRGDGWHTTGWNVHIILPSNKIINVCFKERDQIKVITDGKLPWCVGGHESGSLLITNTGRCFLIVKSIS